MKPSLAKMLLYTLEWDVKEIEQLHQKDANKLLVECRIAPEVQAKVFITPPCGEISLLPMVTS